jgi:acid phosphatase family membrane protein YuiD
MNILSEILSNQPLIVGILAWFVAQSIKIIIRSISGKKIDLKWFLSAGGFVSAHCATVSALATSVGLNFGFNSGLFALSAVLAGVVISDARGIRRAAGKQAEVLNKIIEDLYQKREIKIERLKEFLGHTALEAFWGVLLGILVAIFYYQI